MNHDAHIIDYHCDRLLPEDNCRFPYMEAFGITRGIPRHRLDNVFERWWASHFGRPASRGTGVPSRVPRSSYRRYVTPPSANALARIAKKFDRFD